MTKLENSNETFWGIFKHCEQEFFVHYITFFVALQSIVEKWAKEDWCTSFGFPFPSFQSRSQSQSNRRNLDFKWTKIEKLSNDTFWMIFKHCEAWDEERAGNEEGKWVCSIKVVTSGIHTTTVVELWYPTLTNIAVAVRA